MTRKKTKASSRRGLIGAAKKTAQQIKKQLAKRGKK